MQKDKDRLLNPIQPTYIDDRGTRRFKENAIVELVFENCPYNLTELAKRNFTQTDREQFAQLIGYSVSAFTERYGSDLTIEAVDRMIEDPQISSDRARVLYLEEQLAQLTDLIRTLAIATFNIDAEDLPSGVPIIGAPVVIADPPGPRRIQGLAGPEGPVGPCCAGDGNVVVQYDKYNPRPSNFEQQWER